MSCNADGSGAHLRAFFDVAALFCGPFVWTAGPVLVGGLHSLMRVATALSSPQSWLVSSSVIRKVWCCRRPAISLPAAHDVPRP